VVELCRPAGTRSSISTARPRSPRSASEAARERPALYGDGHAAERCVQAIGEL